MNSLYFYLGLTLVLVSALALVYVFHLRIRPHLPEHDKAKPSGQTLPAAPLLTSPTAAELESRLKTAYEHQITVASQQLGVDLQAASGRLGEQVQRMTTSVIEEELGAYKQTLEEVRKTASETMKQIQQTVDEQRTALRQGMEKELADERRRLVEQFETRMGDVVSSYIAESLGGGVDLGSQLPYITQTLEANKEALKKDLLSGL